MGKKPTIDEANARRLAVKADCDPRTIRKVLRGEGTHSMSAKRAYKILVEAGLLNEEQVAA